MPVLRARVMMGLAGRRGRSSLWQEICKWGGCARNHDSWLHGPRHGHGTRVSSTSNFNSKLTRPGKSLPWQHRADSVRVFSEPRSGSARERA
eukprot:3272111-Rhodomonas_salina.2